VIEGKAVLDSSAEGVPGMVYRYVEAAGAISAGAATRVPSSRVTRRASTGSGRAEASSLSGADDAGPPLPRAKGRPLAPDVGSAPSTCDKEVTNEIEDNNHENDAEAMAAAAAAAIVDAALAEEDDGEEEHDEAAKTNIRAAVGSLEYHALGGAWLSSPAAVATGGTSGYTAAKATGAVTATTGFGAVSGNNGRAANTSDKTISMAARSVTIGDGAASTPRRGAGPRNWRNNSEKAPILKRPPAAIAAPAATVKLVDRLLAICNVRTHARTLMPLLGKSIADTIGIGAVGAKKRLEWWPRQDTKKVSPLRVELSYDPRLNVDKQTRMDAFSRPINVELPSFFCPRNHVSTDIQLAHLIFMVQMEAPARLAFDSFMKMHSKKELGAMRTTQQPPHLASMATLRVAPRAAPSAAQHAARQVFPLPPGSTFSYTPVRPPNHVFKGSNPPNHHTRIPLPLLLAPLPPRSPAPSFAGIDKSFPRKARAAAPAATSAAMEANAGTPSTPAASAKAKAKRRPKAVVPAARSTSTTRKPPAKVPPRKETTTPAATVAPSPREPPTASAAPPPPTPASADPPPPPLASAAPPPTPPSLSASLPPPRTLEASPPSLPTAAAQLSPPLAAAGAPPPLWSASAPPPPSPPMLAAPLPLPSTLAAPLPSPAAMAAPTLPPQAAAAQLPPPLAATGAPPRQGSASAPPPPQPPVLAATPLLPSTSAAPLPPPAAMAAPLPPPQAASAAPAPHPPVLVAAPPLPPASAVPLPGPPTTVADAAGMAAPDTVETFSAKLPRQPVSTSSSTSDFPVEQAMRTRSLRINPFEPRRAQAAAAGTSKRSPQSDAASLSASLAARLQSDSPGSPPPFSVDGAAAVMPPAPVEVAQLSAYQLPHTTPPDTPPLPNLPKGPVAPVDLSAATTSTRRSTRRGRSVSFFRHSTTGEPVKEEIEASPASASPSSDDASPARTRKRAPSHRREAAVEARAPSVAADASAVMVDTPPAFKRPRRSSARLVRRANDEAVAMVEEPQSAVAALPDNASCQLLGPSGKMVTVKRLVKSTTSVHGVPVDPDCVVVCVNSVKDMLLRYPL